MAHYLSFVGVVNGHDIGLQQQLPTAEIQLKLAAAAIVAVVAGPAASASTASAAELSSMSC